VEVYKEAHLLAFLIESKSKNKAAQDVTAEDLWSQGVERFIQESKLKISLFEKEKEMKKTTVENLTRDRRETVSDRREAYRFVPAR